MTPSSILRPHKLLAALLTSLLLTACSNEAPEGFVRSIEPASMVGFFIDMKQLPQDSPVIMINMLKYHEQAVYEEGNDLPPASGEQVYLERYMAKAGESFEGNGIKYYMNSVGDSLIAPPGEEWDAVLLVYYPSVTTAMDVLGEDSYLAIVKHRTAALLDSRLFPVVPSADDPLLKLFE